MIGVVIDGCPSGISIDPDEITNDLERRRPGQSSITSGRKETDNFEINYIKDFTEFEDHDKYLEGTGSMVLDRENKICYAAISIRTDEQAVLQWCDVFDYTPVCFTANQDVDGERDGAEVDKWLPAEDFAEVCAGVRTDSLAMEINEEHDEERDEDPN